MKSGVSLIGWSLAAAFLFFGLMMPNMPHRQAANDRNVGVQANVHNLHMAIEKWSIDHGGRYPRTAEEVSAVVADKAYMAGGVLPRGPWGGRQAAVLPVAGTGLEEIDAKGGNPISTVLGKGRKAGEILAITDYGAIAYDADRKGEYFVLYGIGRRKDQAVVVIALTNAPATSSRVVRARSRS